MKQLVATKPHIEIISPGNRLTVQDLGRRGSQRFGVSVSGVLDIQAAVIANRLVGNLPGSSVLEATFGGVSITFDAETMLAVTGAEVDLAVDGYRVPIWETIIVPKGAELTVSIPSAGLYSYIAIAGGIDVPIVLGSRSTHIASGIGGHEGRALVAGDMLEIGDESGGPTRPRAGTTAPNEIVGGSKDQESRIRVVPGPQFGAFDDDAKAIFLESIFTVSNLTDRQGARLEGPSVVAIDAKHDIVSDPAFMGAVQIPSDGKPIILLADRQPTGGYAKIATVISADLPSVVQRTPGSEIAFELVDIETAQNVSREFARKIHHEPLIQPANIFTSHLAIDGKTYNVEIVRHAKDSAADDGIVYAAFEGDQQTTVKVESI